MKIPVLSCVQQFSPMERNLRIGTLQMEDWERKERRKDGRKGGREGEKRKRDGIGKDRTENGGQEERHLKF